jgi:hypothetical protein
MARILPLVLRMLGIRIGRKKTGWEAPVCQPKLLAGIRGHLVDGSGILIPEVVEHQRIGAEKIVRIPGSKGMRERTVSVSTRSRREKQNR